MQEQDVIIDLALEPRSVPASRGWDWIVQAFQLFRQAPTAWVGISATFVAVMLVMSLIPVLGGFISTLLGPVLLGGMMVAAQSTAQGQKPLLMDLFVGFKLRTIDLIKVGAFYMLGTMVLILLFSTLLVVLQYFGMNTELPKEIESLDQISHLWPLGLLMLLCFSIVYSTYFFAPMLVILTGMNAPDAMKMSFLAFWRNWPAIMLMGLIGGVLMILAALPYFLGLIVALPVALITSYVCYADVFPTPSPSSGDPQ
ncbi:hypothetical protein HQ393_13445 [Chitinibacter bivalviorum]|uniref:Transmembrane protein n=1 Tax=Chitinibacter bivalviorum TaxID=2739434 RepID=A0A7H9BKG0_9NEIS|nr:BPSS1780 family membrane protein [Chitinibacter bivalviorum]QLG89167.1 hypothetical protein HQ393_13445 [Chitinibacter bivalviorum]